MWYALCVQLVCIKSAHCLSLSSGGDDPAGAQPGRDRYALRSDGTLRLFWCTEKPHPMVHWASNRRTVVVCIGGGLLGVLLDLPERIWNIVQTLHTRTKVCKVCKPDNCRLCRNGSSVHSAPYAHFKKKVCKKYASNLHKVCRVCTFSAPSLHITWSFFWEKPPGDNFAHLMHTKHRLMQTSCRYYAD